MERTLFHFHESHFFFSSLSARVVAALSLAAISLHPTESEREGALVF